MPEKPIGVDIVIKEAREFGFDVVHIPEDLCKGIVETFIFPATEYCGVDEIEIYGLAKAMAFVKALGVGCNLWHSRFESALPDKI